MQTGTRISAIGHGLLIALAIFGLPWFGPRERAGLMSFLELARDVGELERVPELRFVIPAEAEAPA